MASGFEGGDTLEWGASSFFPASEVVDLGIDLVLSGLEPGVHVLEVELHTPNGHLYQTLTAIVTTDPARVGTLFQLEGFPHPLSVAVLASMGSGRAGEWATSVVWPVAGTSIVTASLYGHWTFAVTVDGVAVSCPQATNAFIVE